ncbi:hypothetical protein [Microbacterium sp. 179-I 3D4 NHS]|uniref:hypothetical protein n=1 Tax=Microbacterium sp. 179-I 3D4 NHS TaxID=3142381 RepID=UPI0039A181D4
MTDVALGEKAPPLLPGVHRVIRALDASETPFVGLLVTCGDGVAVQLDAEALEGWIGWRHAGAEHVAGPIDVVRRRDGHDVLLPWCTERVATFLGRRRAEGDVLAAGECSTLVASLLRGIGELGQDAGSEAGGWWMTGDGRPVFVFGSGEDARAGATRIVASLAEASGDKAMARLLVQIEAGLRRGASQPRIAARQLEEWERALFDLAVSRPLRSVSVRTADGGVGQHDVPPSRRPAAVGERALSRAEARRRADAGLAPVSWTARLRETVSDLGAAAGRSARERFGARVTGVVSEGRDGRSARRDGTGERRRRRPRLLLAGAAAMIVLVGGLLWPGGGSDDSAVGAAPAPIDAPSTGAPGTGTPELDARPGAPDDAADTVADDGADGGQTSEGEQTASDPVHAVEGLLAALRACEDAPGASCDGVAVPEATALLPELRELAHSRPATALVDEYGDVAVVRLTPAQEVPTEDGGSAITAASAPRVVVIVRVEEKWLVRDVYDVADQPG